MIGSASVAAGAAFLAACGGGSDGNKASTNAAGESSLVTKSVDTTNQAVKGGSLKSYLTSDTPTLDPSTSSFPLNPIAGHRLRHLDQ